jgi:hypothetical protein
MAEKKDEKPAKSESETEITNKISAKRICGKLTAPEKAAALFVVIGVADGLKAGDSNYGPWESLTGQFEATVVGGPTAGQRHYGTQLFLPKGAHDTVAGRLRVEGNTSVEFAMEVGYKPAPDAPKGYEFTFKPISKPGAADPLASLRERVQAALPHLK